MSPYCRRTSVRSLFLYFVFSALLCVLCTTPTARAAPLVEILSVEGCDKKAESQRETTRCFAMPDEDDRAPVRLFLRGLHFPSPTRPGALQVWLEEHQLPPILSLTEESEAQASPGRIRVECRGVKAFAQYPDQLLGCSLSHPAMAGEVSAELLARLQQGPLWMDVWLMIVEEGGGQPGRVTRPLAVLRRAVQLDHPRSGATVDNAQDEASRASLHERSLERLYSGRASRGARADGSNQNRPPSDADDDDLWVELGVGGLKTQLRTLFRRVFLSRLPSLANITTELELQHVRGVILYGPPGNGKSLIARSLTRLLGPDTHVTIVNAADVVSKFVGESEKNLKDVFDGVEIGTSTEAENEATDAAASAADSSTHHEGGGGSRNGLHVLVFDEFEGLFRRRGHSSEESGAKAVYDSITNTLLSLMDGIHPRNDLLVIGLTNRLAAIDSALLRPGRFEVLIEVPSPDADGREEIFFIHTEKLRQKGFLDSTVDLHKLAMRTGGFSASDVAGAVRAAVSYALMRFREGQPLAATAVGGGGGGETGSTACGATPSSITTDEPLACEGLEGSRPRGHEPPRRFRVTAADFELALGDIQNAKDESASLTQLPAEDAASQAPLVDHDGTIEEGRQRIEALIARVARSKRSFAGVVGITGAGGTGKTALAQQIATLHNFGVVRFVSCRRLLAASDYEEQMAIVREAFADVSRATKGLMVLDDLDVLLDGASHSKSSELLVQNLLYDFTQRRRGVSAAAVGIPRAASTQDSEEHSSADRLVNQEGRIGARGSAADATSNDMMRLLVITASSASGLSQLPHDVLVRMHPMTISGVEKALSHYRVVAPQEAALVTRSYPKTLSYRTFIRLTDMALWAVRDEEDEPQAAASELPAFFSIAASDDAEASRRTQEARGFYAYTTTAQAKKFASKVSDLVSAMGLHDPFRSWYRSAGSLEASGEAELQEEASEALDFAEEGDEVLW